MDAAASALARRCFFWVFLAFFSAQSLYLIAAKSPTTDEVPFHLVNGYVNLKTRDFRMSPVQPPLIREWMGLPWFLLRPKLDLSKPSWAAADSQSFCMDLLYRDNRAIADRLLYSARFMIFLLGLGLALVVYAWARDLYGEAAAVYSLGFFAFFPMLVAHSAVGTVDVGATFLITLSLWLLWRHFRTLGAGFPLKPSLAMGAALAAKFTAVLLAPIFLSVYLAEARGAAKKAAWFCLTMILAMACAWGAYFFEWKPLLSGVPRVDEKVEYVRKISESVTFGNAKASARAVEAARTLPVPLSSWWLGLAGMIRERRTPNGHYFLGHWREPGLEHQGKWYYYLFGFLVKSTPAFLAALILRAALARPGGSGRAGLYLLWPASLVFFTACLDTSWRGTRYLMPAMPLLLVWIAGLWSGAGGSRRPKVLRLAAGALLGGHILSAAAQWPNPMSYFNIFVGGPSRGYLYLRDSDLDWGQELKPLAGWLRRNGVDRVKTYLFGSRDESFYGIPSEALGPDEFKRPRAELYAVSTFWLSHLEWTARYRPTGHIAHAIFIYDFRKGVPQ